MRVACAAVAMHVVMTHPVLVFNGENGAHLVTICTCYRVTAGQPEKRATNGLGYRKTVKALLIPFVNLAVSKHIQGSLEQRCQGIRSGVN
ncbi:hypothetical protein F5Y09DRAFT_317844 [Xylaria sp. FL1042]|nr:hypothetical protein F5Y09DRAFT_317844 [Xylaria sp. FL1042]